MMFWVWPDAKIELCFAVFIIYHRFIWYFWQNSRIRNITGVLSFKIQVLQMREIEQRWWEIHWKRKLGIVYAWTFFHFYQLLMSKKGIRALARNLRCPRCWSPNLSLMILPPTSLKCHQHHRGHIHSKCFWVFSWNRPREDLFSVRSKLKLVGIIQMNPNETSKLILFMAVIDKGWRIGFLRYLDVCKSYISIKVI